MLYRPDQVHNSHFICLGVFNLILYIVLCQGKNKNTLILDIDDQNAKYAYLHPKAFVLHV